MKEFKYQFQYDPADLKVIRDASGGVRFSPATSISVWAGGFAVSLLLLGVLGQWLIITAMLLAGFVLLAVFIGRLNRAGFADREYLVRSITISESGVTEEFGHSIFAKSWPAFDGFIDAPNHLLLTHYEKVNAIPKRVIPAEELVNCIDFIQRKLEMQGEVQLEQFSQWFVDDSQYKKYRFRWNDSDIGRLATERMQLYSPADSHDVAKGGQSPILGTFVLLVMVFVLMFLFSSFVSGDNFASIQIAVFAIAISFPFAVALLWWKYTRNVAGRKQPKLPAEEIEVTLDGENLLIGYPSAVGRYSLKDVLAFYHSERFVGFRPVTGMIHVIAKQAFGSNEDALDFLRLADSMRLDCKIDVGEGSGNQGFEPVETGNPFQPPTTNIN